MTKVLSFVSGKGGVGKTTLVANLGSLFSKQGYRTLLIDGDWGLGKLALTMGTEPTYTVAEVLEDKISLAAAVHPVGPKLSLLSAPSGRIGFETLSEERRNRLYFDFEELRDQYDYILMDQGSGIHDDVLMFAAASHQPIVVTSPEPTSYTDAYAIMKVLSHRFHVQNFWLLVSQSHKIQETDEVIERFSDVVRRQLRVRLNSLGTVPWDIRFSESIQRRRAFVETFPSDPLTKQLNTICKRIDKELCGIAHGLKLFYSEHANPSPSCSLG